MHRPVSMRFISERTPEPRVIGIATRSSVRSICERLSGTSLPSRPEP